MALAPTVATLDACEPLLVAQKGHSAAVGEGDDLRTYVRKSFFAYHKGLYENRPIDVPLSSARRSFVAWCSIHRWRDDTLQTVLADHLVPEKRRWWKEAEHPEQAEEAADA